MSRNLKDLREFICISRLTVQDSDDDSDRCEIADYHSYNGNDDADEFSTDEELKIKEQNIKSVNSPDSGFQSLTRSNSDAEAQDSGRKCSKYSNKNQLPSCSSLKSTTAKLPKIVSNASLEPNKLKNSFRKPSPLVRHINIDTILKYLDSNVVAGWLTSCNNNIHKLTNWLAATSNFCNFVNFWLTKSKKEDKRSLIQMEHGIIVDEMLFAFSSGIKSRMVTKQQINFLLKQVFHEYPESLLSPKNSNLFLDFLITLTSKNKKSYKKLLSDVKCRSNVKQHIQDILSVRCFCLISLWSGVISFYGQLQVTKNDSIELKMNNKSTERGSKSGSNSKIGNAVDVGSSSDDSDGEFNLHHKSTNNDNNARMLPTLKDHKNLLLPDDQLNFIRLFSAVKNSMWDVVTYMLKTKKVSLYYRDEREKTLFFHGVTMNNSAFLKLLLELFFQMEEKPESRILKVKRENKNTNNDSHNSDAEDGTRDDVNEGRVSEWYDVLNDAADNGNSPLHAACNLGSLDCVRVLLEESKGYVDVNAVNKLCDGATPLHLAIIHNHVQIIGLLLAHGADVQMKMSRMNALQVAQSFNNSNSQQQQQQQHQQQQPQEIIEMLKKQLDVTQNGSNNS